MLLAKLPLVLASTLSAFLTSSPPNPRVPADARPKALPPFERFLSSAIHSIAVVLSTLILLGGSMEVLVILASTFPDQRLSQMILKTLVNGPTSLTKNISISTTFVIGLGLETLGGIIRRWCYRTLGRHFTLEVTILEKHQLVTSGPYAYVRHPSYPSGIASLVGWGMWMTSPGSWFVECGVINTLVGRICLLVYIAITSFCAVSLVHRSYDEDRLLKKQFGEEWEEWAKRVPCRVIPYIY
ncbi:uncharacterized protein LAESUDRAFT_745986 [Laetiporus sulphureus 93-53]|uniref:Protein-S-isoprenylcysteine O-methyltransferase n=1 Tax=Laetiporus sulphureus 93-53 TaxID=1314785 RepID=A0A165AZY0_9APHY|nr:uncharacterized protein LAESUDRAFT_745986 [Laetiporus sulphureus 93-53]KZS99968.1 hypothetical protein LAESUDRAFT_745986 [Laetiporus sulphureus 93-53]